jgi:predicted dehydrogenase
MTQMGIQGHSSTEHRNICEWIWDGAIGEVREVFIWTDRPIWPQGIDRPLDVPPIPHYLDWDLWIGPSQYRPYHPAYHPWTWRGWLDFGTGALGDIGCHAMDVVFWALKLKYPTQVEASHSYDIQGRSERFDNKETFPRASVVHYHFPARDNMPPVKLHWYDGGLLPETPLELETGRQLGENGTIFLGDKGVLFNGRLIPDTRMKEYQRPPESIPRIAGGREAHEQDWIRACKTGEPAGANFDFSGPLTESVVMGNLAVRYPGQRLEWDGEAMRVTNFDEGGESKSRYRIMLFRDAQFSY